MTKEELDEMRSRLNVGITLKEIPEFIDRLLDHADAQDAEIARLRAAIKDAADQLTDAKCGWPPGSLGRRVWVGIGDFLRAALSDP